MKTEQVNVCKMERLFQASLFCVLIFIWRSVQGQFNLKTLREEEEEEGTEETQEEEEEGWERGRRN